MKLLAKIHHPKLWLLISVLGLLILFAPSKWFPNTNFSEFLDRRWQASKEEFIRARFQPSNKIQILELNYSNPIQFWFDEKTRRELAAVLKTYAGPVLLNLDPEQVLRDPILKSLLENNLHIIRPFLVGPPLVKASLQLSMEAEQIAAKKIEIPLHKRGLYSAYVELIPNDPHYYEKARFAGGLNFSQDAAANSILEYPLLLRGGDRNLPSSALAGAAALMLAQNNCEDWSLSKSLHLQLEKCAPTTSSSVANLKLVNPIPLLFYKRAFHEVTLQQLQTNPANSKKLLIVNVVGLSSYFTNFLGEKMTWATLVATAISNLTEQHFPTTPPAANGLSIFITLLLLISFFAISQKYRFEYTLNAVLVGIALAVALDFFLSTTFNLRTHPVDSFLLLALTGLVAVGTRTLIDWKERSVIEQALSGYVSESRLKRLVSGKERLALEGKRKVLTAMLIDIVQFSKVIENLEIEETFALMQRFFEIVDPIVFKYGGFIDKKTGDGLLAVFGDSEIDEAPAASARAAVLCALEIQDLLPKSREILKSAIPIRTRVGVNSGSMIVGNAGSKKHFNYTVLGEAVNFSQRLEAACPVGEALIGEATANYIKEEFTLIPLEINVKNETKTTKAYIVRKS